MSDYCEHGFAKGKRCPECRPRVRDRVKRRISRYSRGGDLVVAGSRGWRKESETWTRPLGTVDMATGEWTPPPGTLGVDDLPPALREVYESKAWDRLGEVDPRTGNWIQGSPTIRRRWPWRR